MDPLKPKPGFSDLEIGIMAHVFQKYYANTSDMPDIQINKLESLLPKCYTLGTNKHDFNSRFEQARKKICNFDTLQLDYRKSEDSIEAQIQEDGCAMVEITQYVAADNCLGVEVPKSKSKAKTTVKTKAKTDIKTKIKTDSKGIKRPHSD